MQFAVYGAVLLIALGSVLLGLDWASAPMSPMVNTAAGLRAAAPPAPAVPSAAVNAPIPGPTPPSSASNVPAARAATPSPAANVPAARPAPPSPAANIAPPVTPPAPSANIGAPIIAPTLSPAAPTSTTTAAQVPADASAAAPQVRCNVDACTAAYRSFTPSDCTYQPSNGPRRLCTK